MRERGLVGLPRARRRIPNLAGLYTPSGLVERVFTADAPNTLWCTDITEHRARYGKACCCAVIDCFSRKIVGRACSTTADTALLNNAVNMAVRGRSRCGPTIVHVDHGIQLPSWSLGENLRRSGLTPSLGSVGDCFDNAAINAAIEAFWGRFQVECSTPGHGPQPSNSSWLWRIGSITSTTPSGSIASSVASVQNHTSLSGLQPNLSNSSNPRLTQGPRITRAGYRGPASRGPAWPASRELCALVPENSRAAAARSHRSRSRRQTLGQPSRLQLRAPRV